MPKTILIDLDGVLNQYKGDYNPDYIPPIIEGAEEFLKSVSKEYDIKIFTTREAQLVKKWLSENKLNQYISGVTQTKEPAWAYIDDRCIKFEGNFKILEKDIQHFKPWWK